MLDTTSCRLNWIRSGTGSGTIVAYQLNAKDVSLDWFFSLEKLCFLQLLKIIYFSRLCYLSCAKQATAKRDALVNKLLGQHINNIFLYCILHTTPISRFFKELLTKGFQCIKEGVLPINDPK